MVKEVCPKCHGRGITSKKLRCPVCKGRKKGCTNCKERGFVFDSCNLCESYGWIKRKKQRRNIYNVGQRK